MSILENLISDKSVEYTGLPHQQDMLLSSAVELLKSPEVGGPVGFVRMLAEMGHGDVAASWLSRDKNLPLAPHTLMNIFGPDKIHKLAGNLGLPVPSLLSGLAAVLPLLIDRLSPGGKLLSGQTTGKAMEQIMKGLHD